MEPTAIAPTAAAPSSWPPPPDPATAPVVQVKNFISAGSVSTDSTSMTKPISTVRGFLPEPIMVNATAYTAAAAGLYQISASIQEVIFRIHGRVSGASDPAAASGSTPARIT